MRAASGLEIAPKLGWSLYVLGMTRVSLIEAAQGEACALSILCLLQLEAQSRSGV